MVLQQLMQLLQWSSGYSEDEDDATATADAVAAVELWLFRGRWEIQYSAHGTEYYSKLTPK